VWSPDTFGETTWLLRPYNPRVSVVVFDATGGATGCEETLGNLGSAWLTQATVNDEQSREPLPIVLVGLFRSDNIPPEQERITAAQALAAAGGAAAAYVQCTPSSGHGELMQTVARLCLALGEEDEVSLLSNAPRERCAIL
jgi:hypothetical protein